MRNDMVDFLDELINSAFCSIDSDSIGQFDLNSLLMTPKPLATDKSMIKEDASNDPI